MKKLGRALMILGEVILAFVAVPFLGAMVALCGAAPWIGVPFVICIVLWVVICHAINKAIFDK